MREITKRQFDAYCYARQPLIRMITEEVAWFEAFDRKILAVITYDKVDSDFGYVILGRDARRMFRCIEVCDQFYRDAGKAHAALSVAIEEYRDDGHELYPQGDEAHPPNEIFVPVVQSELLHPYFETLINESRFEAARNLIREIMYSYSDPDDHYIREFQTKGFDARLWELYLYVYLHGEGFEFISGNPSPDFHLRRFDREYHIEAVTVNPSLSKDRPDPPPPEDENEVLELMDGYLPIKYGSPLYTKLQKEYWEMRHVAGKPLIIAVHDYHMPGSMTWTRTALSEYLYGIRTRLSTAADGTDEAETQVIQNHEWQQKVIPSAFFWQEDVENISAVLFSNAATITKFNRMGKLAGLGSDTVKMIRQGARFDPDPNALRPIVFSEDIDDPEYEESWSESIIMYHNPNAKVPVDPDDFPSISHVWYDTYEEEFVGYQQPYDVLASVTVVISPSGESGAGEETA